MQLTPRPMAEAPDDELIVIAYINGKYSCACFRHGEERRGGQGHAIGFVTIGDLLRAAEIVEKITPEGMIYDSHEDATIYSQVLVRFRKLPPPVRYEWATDGVERKPIAGQDYIKGIPSMRIASIHDEETPRLCFRRVEVKP